MSGTPIEKKTVRDIAVGGKRVLVRADLNVPLARGGVADDTRIRESLPTLRYLREEGAHVILCSHLGRPKGRDDTLSLSPVAGRLGNLLGQDVIFAEDCIGEPARQAVDVGVRQGRVVLLENLRFHPGEEANDPDFARELASLAEVYVDDAFGAAHRAHASTEGVTHYLPAVAGLLMEKEVRYLGGLVARPPRPFAAVIGGAKVSTKLPAIEHLLPRIDLLLLGGGMANTFLKARGVNVQASLVEDQQLDDASRIVREAEARDIRVYLPTDVVVADEPDERASAETVRLDHVRPGKRILDIGPATVQAFDAALRVANAVIWNGPMGVFEVEKFAAGTRAIATAIANLEATTVVGGGETAQVVAQLGLQDRFTHVSTGGGASLEMLEGKTLPGVAALMDA